jgi:hypothetical protein
MQSNVIQVIYEDMKNYTDIEQSRKLAEILPLESADGFWNYHNYWYSEGDEWEGYEDYPRAEPYLEYTRKENEWKEDKSDVPCWSLAALLGVLPDYTLQTTTDKKVFVTSDSKKPMMSDTYDNPVDACVEMILKLHELKQL